MRVQRVALPGGQRGIDATVAEMAKAAMGQYGAGSAKIRSLTLDVIRAAGVTEKDQPAEVRAVHKWVQGHLRYVRDPVWYEFVTFPETLAFDQADGDCDDHSVLESAMLGSIGIPTRFVTFSFRGGSPSHVALQALVAGAWIPLDPIVKDKPAGWQAPDATKTDIYGISGPDGAKAPASGLARIVGILITLGGIVFMLRAALKRVE